MNDHVDAGRNDIKRADALGQQIWDFINQSDATAMEQILALSNVIGSIIVGHGCPGCRKALSKAAKDLGKRKLKMQAELTH